MNLSRNVAEIIREYVTLEVESIDRVYLNVYQPQLQRDLWVGWFLSFPSRSTVRFVKLDGQHDQDVCGPAASVNTCVVSSGSDRNYSK